MRPEDGGTGYDELALREVMGSFKLECSVTWTTGRLCTLLASISRGCESCAVVGLGAVGDGDSTTSCVLSVAVGSLVGWIVRSS